MLGRLVCGDPGADCVANATLNHLANSINHFSAKAVGYLSGDFNEDAQSFGAFCTRVVLENACAALVGRLDPFRLLYLTEFQSQGDFDYGRPTKAGFRWTGDVLSEDKPVRALWDPDQDTAKVSRALLSAHADHVYWQSAAEHALDYLATLGQKPTTYDLLNIDPATFVTSVKGRLTRLYYTLSKGVHWDFFTSAIVMDEETLKDAIRDCLAQLARLSYVSHFVPTAYRSLERGSALQVYRDFRGLFQ